MADLDSFALDLEAATDEVIATAPKAKKRPRAAKAPANGSGSLAAESKA